MRADVVGRAMRLIADGVVDREGVARARRAGSATASATCTGCSSAEVGAGPLALARAQRAQTARMLIETTDLPFAEVAFAAGFASIRQFNDTVREVFAHDADRAARPRRNTHARRAAGRDRPAPRLPRPVRRATSCSASSAARAVAGRRGVRRRRRTAASLDLPHGHGGRVGSPAGRRPRRAATLTARRRRATSRTAVAAVPPAARPRRRPGRVDDALGADPRSAPLVRDVPGLRVPGAVDGDETRRRAPSSASRSRSPAPAPRRPGSSSGYGTPLTVSPTAGSPTSSPTRRRSPDVDPTTLADAARRGRALVAVLPSALATARSASTPAPTATRRGARCWPAGHRAVDGRLRARCGRSATPTRSCRPTSASATGSNGSVALDPAERNGLAERWRPWRSYALMHLWGSLWRPDHDHFYDPRCPVGDRCC